MNDHYKVGRQGPEDTTPPDLGVFLDHLSQDAKGWVEAQKEYTLLIVSERFGRMSASLLVVFLLALFLSTAVLMSTIALGLYLGELWNSMPLGFLCISGGYLLLALLFVLFGKQPIKDMITLNIINASRDEDTVS
jgi:hypothetical protein